VLKFKAEIDVMPKEGILDPRGEAISKNMEIFGINNTSEVTLGKHIRLILTSPDEETAYEKVKEACERLLANRVMETFTINLTQIL